MKKRIIFLISVFIAVFCIFSCASQKNKSQQELIELEPDYFHKEDNFSFIGKIEDKSAGELNVYMNEHFFAQNDSRVACRLVLFGEKNSIWMYKLGSNEKPTVKNNAVVFPFDAKYGNSITLKNGKLPDEAYLDSELIPLVKLK